MHDVRYKNLPSYSFSFNLFLFLFLEPYPHNFIEDVGSLKGLWSLLISNESLNSKCPLAKYYGVYVV